MLCVPIMTIINLQFIECLTTTFLHTNHLLLAKTGLMRMIDEDEVDIYIYVYYLLLGEHISITITLIQIGAN